MRGAIFFYVILSSVWGYSQTEDLTTQTEDELKQEIKNFQTELNEHYKNKETSPFKKNKDRRKFKGHNFYEIDLDYYVKATVVRVFMPDTVTMITSAGTEKHYLNWAKLKFEIKGVSCELTAYRSTGKHNDYLFVPFKDATSGKDSYGGGRYLDLKIPKSNSIYLNFNLAYNPYCAYTSGWFCPIPPAENTLEVAIRAGLKAPDNH